jgi:hypothetical protein
MAETITVSLTIVIDADGDFTAAQKEAALKQQVLEEAFNDSQYYDTGIHVTGEVSSTCSETVPIDHHAPLDES